jgi:hypothetical protein
MTNPTNPFGPDYSFAVQVPSEPGTYVLNNGVLEKLFDDGPLDLTKPLLPAAQRILEGVQEVIRQVDDKCSTKKTP